MRKPMETTEIDEKTPWEHTVWVFFQSKFINSFNIHYLYNVFGIFLMKTTIF